MEVCFMIGVDEMIEILDKMQDLPTLPTVYAKVTNLMNNPKSSINDIAKIIEVDQSLTSKILRLVNSSFFGFSRKVVSINQAIVLMGFNTIRNTVLSVSVFKGFSGHTNHGFDLQQFWKHAIACGIISSVLDQKLRAGFRDEAFVAGLLHDMGKVILNRYFASEFNLTISFAKESQVSFYNSERSVIGFSHDEVGEYLADKWQLPFSLVETVALHHQPDNIRSNPKLVSIINLADTMTYNLGFGFLNDFKQDGVHPFVLRELDLTNDSMPELFKEGKEALVASNDLFALLM
jgi:HD-like signal output (HDOD) protein